MGVMVQILAPLVVTWTFETSPSRPNNLWKSLWVAAGTFSGTEQNVEIFRVGTTIL